MNRQDAKSAKQSNSPRLPPRSPRSLRFALNPKSSLALLAVKISSLSRMESPCGFGPPTAAPTSFSTAATSSSASNGKPPAAFTSPSITVSIKIREHPHRSPVLSTSCSPLETSPPPLATSISGAVHIDLRCFPYRQPDHNSLIFNENSPCDHIITGFCQNPR
jgi:hypothetical protein